MLIYSNVIVHIFNIFSSFQLAKTGQYIQVLLTWELVSKRKESLDQMKIGLSTLDFLEKVKDLEDLESILSEDGSQEMTANYVRKEVKKSVSSLECHAIEEHKSKDYMLACVGDLTGLCAIITVLLKIGVPVVSPVQIGILHAPNGSIAMPFMGRLLLYMG